MNRYVMNFKNLVVITLTAATLCAADSSPENENTPPSTPTKKRKSTIAHFPTPTPNKSEFAVRLDMGIEVVKRSKTAPANLRPYSVEIFCGNSVWHKHTLKNHALKVQDPNDQNYAKANMFFAKGKRYEKQKEIFKAIESYKIAAQVLKKEASEALSRIFQKYSDEDIKDLKDAHLKYANGIKLVNQAKEIQSTNFNDSKISELYDEATMLFGKALDTNNLSPKMEAELTNLLYKSYMSLGIWFCTKGEIDRGIENFTEALELSGVPEDERLAQAHYLALEHTEEETDSEGESQ